MDILITGGTGQVGRALIAASLPEGVRLLAPGRDGLDLADGGSIAAAVASIVFGLTAPVGDFRVALLWTSAIAAAAALCSCWLPERTHENEAT